jgi:hypothetical protein
VEVDEDGSGNKRLGRFAHARSAEKDFTDHLATLTARIECRRAHTSEERQAIYRLRYQAYLRDGTISANPFGRFADAADDAENAYLFGFYIDGKLASSLRLHIGSKEHPEVPSIQVFPDILRPLLDAGRVIIDITYFVADEAFASVSRLAVRNPSAKHTSGRAFPR